jgi:antitoxin (DNA-binding transcriptional repressor) of toxin-antitoxin stability system
MRIGIKQARNQFNQLLRRAENGENVIICRRGRPTAKLRRIGPPVRTEPAPGLIERIFAESEKLEKELAKMFRKDGGDHGN